MLFSYPLELFPFPLVAQNYSHSRGNPITGPMQSKYVDLILCIATQPNSHISDNNNKQFACLSENKFYFSFIAVVRAVLCI